MQTLCRIADWTLQDEPRFAGIRAALVLGALFAALAIAFSLAPSAGTSAQLGLGQLISWQDGN